MIAKAMKTQICAKSFVTDLHCRMLGFVESAIVTSSWLLGISREGDTSSILALFFVRSVVTRSVSTENAKGERRITSSEFSQSRPNPF